MQKLEIPKYSEKINFFFVIFGKEIPMKTGLWTAIRSQLSLFPGFHSRTLPELDPRTHNTENLPSPKARCMEEIKEAFDMFVRVTGNFLIVGMRTGNSKILGGLDLESEAVQVINEALQEIDHTWLENYGTIRATELQLTSKDFMEVMSHRKKLGLTMDESDWHLSCGLPVN